MTNKKSEDEHEDDMEILDLSILDEDMDLKYELEELVNRYVYIETNCTSLFNQLFWGKCIGIKNLANTRWAVLVDAGYYTKAKTHFTKLNEKNEDIGTAEMPCLISYIKLDEILSIEVKEPSTGFVAPTTQVNNEYEDLTGRYVYAEMLTKLDRTNLNSGTYKGIRCLGGKPMLYLKDADHINHANIHFNDDVNDIHTKGDHGYLDVAKILSISIRK